jgi:hypothetical protein
MSDERLALLAAKSIRDKLIPVMPIITVAGKRGKVKPVCFVQLSEGIRTVLFAVPEGTQLPEIPTELYGIEIRQKAWEGPAPRDVQNLALKAFGGKK